MSRRSLPPADAPPVSAAWQEIEAVLEELAIFAASGVTAEQLQSRILERLVSLLAAAGGMVWQVEPQGNVTLAAQLQLGEALAGERDELARHQQSAALVAQSGELRV